MHLCNGCHLVAPWVLSGSAADPAVVVDLHLLAEKFGPAAASVDLSGQSGHQHGLICAYPDGLAPALGV